MRFYSRGRDGIESQHNSFNVLCCERCGVVVPDPEPPGAEVLAIAASNAPLVHAECGEMLGLWACMIHPDSTTVQPAGRGGTISHVATMDALAAAKRRER